MGKDLFPEENIRLLSAVVYDIFNEGPQSNIKWSTQQKATGIFSYTFFGINDILRSELV